MTPHEYILAIQDYKISPAELEKSLGVDGHPCYGLFEKAYRLGLENAIKAVTEYKVTQ